MIRPLRHRLGSLFSPQGFRGPVLTLLSGTTVLLALSYFSQPILTRLYSPDNFGLADYFVSIVVVLMSFSSLRYEDALMTPETDRDAATVWWLALAVLVGLSSLLSLSLFWHQELASLMRLPDLAPWLLAVPGTILFMRLAKLCELWLIRKKQFRAVSAGQVTGTATMISVRIGAGLSPTWNGAGGLIGGFVAGQVATLLLFGRAIPHSDVLALRQGFSVAGMREAAFRYRHFPLFSTPSTFFSALVSRLPVLLLPLFFDAATIGFFGRAFNTLAIPLSLVGGAIAQVFFVHAAEAHRNDQLAEMTRIIHQRLVMLGLFPTLLLMLAGPDLFEIVFGANWRVAGEYVRFLAPWLLLSAIASPLTRLFDILGRQRLDFFTSLTMLILLGLAMLIGGYRGEVTTALLLVGMAGFGVRLIQTGILLHLAKVPWHHAIKAYGRYLGFGLPGLLLLVLSMWLGPAWLTTVTALIAGGLYAMIVLWKDQLLASRPSPDGHEEPNDLLQAD